MARLWISGKVSRESKFSRLATVFYILDSLGTKKIHSKEVEYDDDSSSTKGFE